MEQGRWTPGWGPFVSSVQRRAKWGLLPRTALPGAWHATAMTILGCGAGWGYQAQGKRQHMSQAQQGVKTFRKRVLETLEWLCSEPLPDGWPCLGLEDLNSSRADRAHKRTENGCYRVRDRWRAPDLTWRPERKLGLGGSRVGWGGALCGLHVGRRQQAPGTLLLCVVSATGCREASALSQRTV